MGLTIKLINLVLVWGVVLEFSSNVNISYKRITFGNHAEFTISELTDSYFNIFNLYKSHWNILLFSITLLGLIIGHSSADMIKLEEDTMYY